MVLYKCYFCNFNTIYTTNFRAHIKKKHKCNYLIKDLKIDNIEDYNKLVELHKTDPDNKIWGKDVNKLQCEYCNRILSRKDSLIRHKKTCKMKDMDDFINSIDDVNIVFFQQNIDLPKENKIEQEKKFECEYCNRKFSRKYNLQRHQPICDRKGILLILDFLETI